MLSIKMSGLDMSYSFKETITQDQSPIKNRFPGNRTEREASPRKKEFSRMKSIQNERGSPFLEL